MTSPRNALGRGLDALIPSAGAGAARGLEHASEGETAAEIPLERIDRNPEQPRRAFDSEQLEQIYTRLQQLWYEHALGLPLYQTINLRSYRNYVRGFVPNPILTDAWEDLKRLKKE